MTEKDLLNDALKLEINLMKSAKNAENANEDQKVTGEKDELNDQFMTEIEALKKENMDLKSKLNTKNQVRENNSKSRARPSRFSNYIQNDQPGIMGRFPLEPPNVIVNPMNGHMNMTVPRPFYMSQHPHHYPYNFNFHS